MIEQLLGIIALATSITAGAAVMSVTMQFLRPFDPRPARPPRPHVPDGKDVH